MDRHPLAAYGDCIATYSGQGTFTLQTAQTVSCSFEVGQLRSGQIILLCDFLPSDTFLPIPIQKFDGVTPQGFHLSTVGPIVYGDFQTSSDSGGWTEYHLSELTIQFIENRQPKQIHFGVTNLLFDKGFQICLDDRGNRIVLSVDPIKDVEEMMWRVRKLKSIAVTCEVSADIALNGEYESLSDAMNNLCYLLSIARGTKIQWLYLSLYDENGVCLSTTHAAKVTKIYCPLSIIDDEKETLAFLEATYSNYVANRERYELELGTIDAYLDAKAENDYLQLRALKLAVAMEALKAIMLKSVDNFGGEYILPQEDFKGLSSTLKKFFSSDLKAQKVSSDDRDAIYRKLPELNRRAFKEILTGLLTHIQLAITQHDLDLFVKCRDSLVHQVRFYCQTATPEDIQRVPPLPTPQDEYFFLVNFLDKVMLKLLGYSDPYIDHHLPELSTHAQI